MAFIMQELPGGDIRLKRAAVVPVNERWLHEPAMTDMRALADEWMRQSPPRESNLDEFDCLA